MDESKQCCQACGITEAGASQGFIVRELRVEGLDCPTEARPIRAALTAVPAVKDVIFELLASKVVVTYDPHAADEHDLIAAISRAGFAAEVVASPLDVGMQTVQPDRRKEISILASVLLLIFAAGWCVAAGESWLALLECEISTANHLPALAALIGAIGLAWWFVLPKAWRAARALRPDLHLLMTIAVIGAIGLGEWFEAASVAVLFGLANLLESWSAERVRRAVLALMAGMPQRARLQTQQGPQLVPVEQVRPGQIVLVFPGEKVPMDGRVSTGTGFVDQSPITGESRPIEKEPGSEVFAGSISQDGSFEVEATRTADRSLMAEVIRLVRLGQANKSRSEYLVDRFARYYTPVVLALAALLAAGLPLIGVLEWRESFYRALVLLVISCPCALVISTPVAVVSAMTALARGGALVKAGKYLETLAGVHVVALDKTGTLTIGRPEVDAVIPLNGYGTDEILQAAASVESRSEHALARAIMAAAQQRDLPIEPCTEFAALPGRGAVALTSIGQVFVGNMKLIQERGLPADALREHLERHADCHHTAVLVATQAGPIGLILVADRVRPEAASAIECLKAGGLRTAMLTGDNQGTARAIAAQARVDEVRAELLPADKVQAVADLRDRYGGVAMVGDGINDAPALAAADIGIAMGTIGTDAAIQTADVALMSDDLLRLPWLIDHCIRTRRTIVVNIAAAVGIKVVFLVMAAFGLAGLWLAIVADMGASLAVTFNGMRLLSAPQRRTRQRVLEMQPEAAARQGRLAPCLVETR